MVFCSAFNCQNRSRLHCGKSFYSFPLQNKRLIKIWLRKIEREKFYPTKHSRLCSDHFTPDCIVQSRGSRKTSLKANAFPTIFNFSVLPKKRKRRKDCASKREDGSKAQLQKQCQQETDSQDPLICQSSHLNDESSSPPDLDHLVSSIVDSSQNFMECKDNRVVSTFKTIIPPVEENAEVAAFEIISPAEEEEEEFPLISESCLKPDSVKTQYILHRHLTDHTYDISDKIKLARANLENERLLKRCRYYQKIIKKSKRKIKRMKSKVLSLSSALKKLKDKNLITNNLEDLLSHNFHPVMAQLLKKSQTKYKTFFTDEQNEKDQEVKDFCLTLHIYSPKAYKFLRNYFTLPHPTTLRRWRSGKPIASTETREACDNESS